MIQQYEKTEDIKAHSDEEVALEAAYNQLYYNLLAQVREIGKISFQNEKERAASISKSLIGIRDKILRLQLISIELASEDDAYLIFETLNTRGKDLTTSDLVKNHLTRLLKPKTRGVDRAKDKWNAILELFKSSESNIDINRFLHHSWLSRRNYTTTKKLFKDIKIYVNKNNAIAYLDDLLYDAKIYRIMMEPSSHR